MGAHVSEMGKHLEKTVKNYNNFVGILEISVMSKARRFNELEVEGTREKLTEFAPKLTEFAPIEVDVRQSRNSMKETSPPECPERAGGLLLPPKPSLEPG
jgi:DNA anti-recombination protein RmuC